MTEIKWGGGAGDKGRGGGEEGRWKNGCSDLLVGTKRTCRSQKDSCGLKL